MSDEPKPAKKRGRPPSLNPNCGRPQTALAQYESPRVWPSESAPANWDSTH
jgi:hypothetical protein